MKHKFYILKADTLEPYESWQNDIVVFTKMPTEEQLAKFISPNLAKEVLKEGTAYLTEEGSWGEYYWLQEVEGVLL